MLRVTDLHVRYGEMEAVRGVSFEVRAGEAVAVLGANGAGKTTILKTVMGLVAPSEGRIDLDGQPLGTVGTAERARRGLAWVPEGRRLFPNLTVEDNLRAGAHGRRDRDAVRQDLERVWTLFPVLRERTRQMAKTLSGGEQQMCAIGRALMRRPRLLLIDEASLGLAPILVGRVFATIEALVADGLTMLVVEQNARQALGIVNRAYVLEAGRIVHAGAREALLADPAVRTAYLGG
ncbi:MAG: ABC transporter ATP-binding protein [Candidatus Rokubacteria bacterium GWF2_70_14]|nr:MAG: ABC transporter ATP-binding protein [Candidatus Rokubacteria bacterium GWF2_70_14]